MALLRRGSSKISDENFNSRLQREKAKTGAITASLAWNDPSDLDLHAYVDGTEICYRKKEAAGGVLDVDMHARDGEVVSEPVENIFWKKPPAGQYHIRVKLFKKRGARAQEGVPFKVLLKREDEEDKTVEGKVKDKSGVNCFSFTVDDEGSISMQKALQSGAPTAMKAVVAMRTAAKAKAKAKVKAKVKAKAKALPMKSSTVAKGKRSKVQVYKGQKLKTQGGLKKEDLVKNKGGKIVSSKKSANAKESKWAKATAKAREVKGFTGFRPLKKGTSFYEKTKEIMAQM